MLYPLWHFYKCLWNFFFILKSNIWLQISTFLMHPSHLQTYVSAILLQVYSLKCSQCPKTEKFRATDLLRFEKLIFHVLYFFQVFKFIELYWERDQDLYLILAQWAGDQKLWPLKHEHTRWVFHVHFFAGNIARDSFDNVCTVPISHHCSKFWIYTLSHCTK